MKFEAVDNEERERWVMNYEPLYLSYESSGLSIEAFVSEFKEVIDAIILANLNTENAV